MQSVTSRIIELDDDEYLISYNGARVVTAKSGTRVFEWSVSAAVISEAIEYARKRNVHIQGYVDGKAYTNGEATDADERRRGYHTGTSMPVHLTEDLAARLGASTPKLIIIDDPPKMPRHIEELTALSNGRFRVTLSKPHYLEIIHPEVSKGAALARLAGELGIPIEETVAVGDSFNDIEMVEAAGLGVAVANAIPELKAVADVVLERTADDGAIAEIAERFFTPKA